MDQRPTLLINPEITLRTLGARGSIHVDGGMVMAGQTVRTEEGDRFIWYADNTGVVFVSNKRVYRQNGDGFRADLRMAPAIIGARGALGMARLGDAELEFLMGLLAGAHWVGFGYVIGSEIAHYIGENAGNFDRWSRELGALLKARDILKSSCPKTYDIMFSKCLRRALGEVYDHMGEAVTLEVVAFAVGVIVGHGGEAIYKGSFRVGVIISTTIKQIFIRFILNVAPGAIAIAGQSYQEVSMKMLMDLRSTGILVTDSDIRAMVVELDAHRREAKLAYDYLVEGFGPQ